MSYLASSPRPFDPQAQHDLNLSSHIQRQQQQQQHPVSAYPAYPPSHQPIPNSPSSSHPPSYATDQPSSSLPKVGQTRCYWALLTADLVFIYLDPVLASHLEDQAELLVGKSIFTFVHPDEQASAKQDLGGVLDSRTLHGSVTRVRFSRLSRVRRQLGYDGPTAPWTDADKVAVDSEYMAVDIVINWAAEGLVLCFIHAIVDLSPGDNDEQHKTDWTNWCGTPVMPPEQIELLYRRLLICVPQPATLSRVFQILGHEQGRPLLLSWPPDQGAGPTGRDFAKLVENVQIASGMPNGTDAKTSCTRRYKALQDMPSVVGGQVESIFIPHGSIIFACHKVETPSRSAVNSSATMQQLGYNPTNYAAQNPPYYDQQGGSYALPPLSPTATYNSAYMPQQAAQIQAPYSPQRWSQQVIIPAAGVSNLRSGSYLPPLPQPQQQWQTTPYVDTSSQQAYARPLSPTYTYSPTTPATTTGGSAATSPTADVVPPPRRRVSPGSSRDQYTGTTRNSSNRPSGVLKCSSCKATTSPEWRKGPSGKKELCNACGLRYARSRAKKEGHNQAQRRRKDSKGITKRESATPPTSASPSYSAVRRSFGEGSFSTSSAGSASGSDIYPHSGHPILENLTPSPSPPASNMNFVHYTPGADIRPPYSSSTSTFYSAPSPLSNSTMLHPQEQQPTTQLPPLGQISSYVDRMPSMVQSGSPISHSPLASTLPAASFERERERDRDLRELPQTPLTAEPRHSRRSILSQQ